MKNLWVIKLMAVCNACVGCIQHPSQAGAAQSRFPSAFTIRSPASPSSKPQLASTSGRTCSASSALTQQLHDPCPQQPTASTQPPFPPRSHLGALGQHSTAHLTASCFPSAKNTEPALHGGAERTEHPLAHMEAGGQRGVLHGPASSC